MVCVYRLQWIQLVLFKLLCILSLEIDILLNVNVAFVNLFAQLVY